MGFRAVRGQRAWGLAVEGFRASLGVKGFKGFGGFEVQGSHFRFRDLRVLEGLRSRDLTSGFVYICLFIYICV